MYPVASTNNAPRPEERRCHPRLKATSIMFAHLGSDNGGIVLNLGLDGVACQAAMKLIAQQNSTLNVHLRGSGLNVELLGEIVWMGATQKEVGIRFKDCSASVQQEIASWIERQTKAAESAPLVERPRPRPMTAMPTPISSPGERLVTHPLSATLAMAQEKLLDSPPGVDDEDSRSPSRLDSVDAITSVPLRPEIVPPIQRRETAADRMDLPAEQADTTPAPLDSVNATTSVAPQPEIIPPIQHGEIPVDELDIPAQQSDYVASSASSSLPSDIGQPRLDQPISESFPVEPPSRAPATFASPTLFTRIPPPVQESLPLASPKPAVPSNAREAEEIRAIVLKDRFSPAPDRLVHVNAAERWLPPAVLEVWRRGTHEQKLLLAGIASACLSLVVLLMITAVIHISGYVSQSAGSASSQQFQMLPETASAGPKSPRANSPHPIVVPGTEDPDDPDQPQSPLVYLKKIFLGAKPEKSDEPVEIDPDDIGVPVWTSKSSGYYYCTDTPYYLSVRPGTFMSQRDALQSGYQPKLGQFCN